MLSDQDSALSPAVASSLMCLSDGYQLFYLWVFGNSAVHLQIQERLHDLMHIPLPVNSIFPTLKFFE